MPDPAGNLSSAERALYRRGEMRGAAKGAERVRREFAREVENRMHAALEGGFDHLMALYKAIDHVAEHGRWPEDGEGEVGK